MSLSTNTTYRVLVEKIGGTNPSEFTGDAGELFYDPSVPALKLSNGSTAGGVAIGGVGIGTNSLTDGVDKVVYSDGRIRSNTGTLVIDADAPNGILINDSNNIPQIEIYSSGVVSLSGPTVEIYGTLRGSFYTVSGGVGTASTIPLNEVNISLDVGVGNTEFYLPNGTEGQIIYLTPGTQSGGSTMSSARITVDSIRINSVGIATVRSTGGDSKMFYPFAGGSNFPTVITLAYTNDAWNSSGGSWA